jgi:hypothetical protein
MIAAWNIMKMVFQAAFIACICSKETPRKTYSGIGNIDPETIALLCNGIFTG